jgi:predicted flap endonuclease-1-like 5' DNA nuclease
MSEQPQDIRQWIQELISRSAKDQMHNLQRFEELVRRATAGEIDQSELRNEYLAFARQESTRYINDLTRVGLSFYNTILELNSNYNDRFFQHAFQEERVHPMTPDAEGPARKVVEMELRGTLGEHAERSFVIENQRTQDVSVSFLISEFESEDGSIYFRPPLQIAPTRFSLRPGQERMVNLKIPLLPEFFAAGKVYYALVIVSGFENLQLRLKVRADEVQESSSPQAGKSPSDRPGPTFLPVVEPQPSAQTDDLTIIKGIGPAYQRKLHETGFHSYIRLATAEKLEVEKLLGKQIAVRAARDKWGEQARLAAEADWKGLQALQKSLDRLTE